MLNARKCLFAAALILAGVVAAQTVTVNIDASRTAAPITRLVFGGFIEPATTSD